MLALRVTIVRWVDDHQPGWVECHLIDCWGRSWVFIEKAPVVSGEALGPDTSYPRPGMIACQVAERALDAVYLWDHREVLPPEDCKILVVDTAVPWGVESTTGETRFEVRADQVMGLMD